MVGGENSLSSLSTVVASQCLKVLFTSSLESTTDRYSAKKGYFDARIRIYYQVSGQGKEGQGREREA